ncbi:Protein of unknown function [Gryllus bimaculatus]|nr:Protein of unknown function [Gryllus bimaculatus]
MRSIETLREESLVLLDPQGEPDLQAACGETPRRMLAQRIASLSRACRPAVGSAVPPRVANPTARARSCADADASPLLLRD